MSAILSYLSLDNLLFCFIGTAVGIMFGAIPGLTSTMGVALMLPFTFGMGPVEAFALLLGIYCGGTFGGSITAILIRTPGSPASAATVLDGYPLAKQGKASKALSMAVTASAVGGLFSCIVLICVAPQLAKIALKFGPPEYFAVGIFGLSIVAGLSAGNLKKGILAAAFGLCLTTIGLDPMTGNTRYTFGMVGLMGGISFIPVLIGVFAISEVLFNLESRKEQAREEITDLHGERLRLSDLKSNIGNFIRSAIIGTAIGIIPATGSGVAGWISYNTARNSSKKPELFGNGSLEGLVASETSNNAVTGGALVPLLTLGIPGDVVTAIMMGALMLQGLTPGPNLFTQNVDIINGIYIMLFISNIFMLLIGLTGIRLFVKVLRIPTQVLMPLVLILCLVGAYAIQNSVLDMSIALLMGIIGYLLRKAEYPLPPLLLGMVLGSIIESNFRRALTISLGSLSIFVTRPICLAFLLISVISCLTPSLQTLYHAFKSRGNAA